MAKKQRSKRSYKLGAQKAAKTREKNKIIKELDRINKLPKIKTKIGKKGQEITFVNYQGEKIPLKNLQNNLIGKIIEINTDYIEPLTEKLNRGKKNKINKRIEKFKEREGVFTEYTARAWEKSDFLDTLKQTGATKFNGINLKKDADKIQELLDRLFEDMTSKDIAGYSLDEETGQLYFFKNKRQEIDESEINELD